jgi:autotransporter-associated beta strand protein/T5SS/PEP-CTERM-associated repeat protein
VIGYEHTAIFNGVLVTGANSLLSNSLGVIVGFSGSGELLIANRAQVIADGGITIAANSGSSGYLFIGTPENNEIAGSLVTPMITFGLGSSVLGFEQKDTITLTSSIIGPGNIWQEGFGMTIISGNSAGFTGTNHVNAGILEFANTSALYGGNTNLWTASNIVVNGGVVAFAVGGADAFTADNITLLLGNLTNVSSGGLYNAGGFGIDSTGTNFTLTNSIGDSVNGQLAMAFIGSGTTTVTGSNTYTGNTLVNGGALIVNGSIIGNNQIYVGENYAGSAMTISSNSQVFSLDSWVGFASSYGSNSMASANSNSMLIIGSGVLFSNATNCELGAAYASGISNNTISLSNTLTISNFGQLTISAFIPYALMVGDAEAFNGTSLVSVAGGNAVSVVGGALISSAGGSYLGAAYDGGFSDLVTSYSNSQTINSGGQVIIGGINIIGIAETEGTNGNVTSSGNYVLAADGGTLFSNGADLYIGYAGDGLIASSLSNSVTSSSNSLMISNGALVLVASNIWVGYAAAQGSNGILAANDNTIAVTGGDRFFPMPV